MAIGLGCRTRHTGCPWERTATDNGSGTHGMRTDMPKAAPGRDPGAAFGRAVCDQLVAVEVLVGA